MVYVDVIDADITFVRRLQQYVRGHPRWSKEMIIRGFSGWPAWEKTGASRRPDLLLVHSALLDKVERKKDLQGIKIGVICDKPPEAEERPREMRGFHKYRPADEWLFEIRDELAGRNGAGGNGSKKAAIYSVFSPAGGAGVSTLACHVTQELIGRGRRALLVSLEAIPGIPLLSDREEGGRLFYLLRHKREQLPALWRQEVRSVCNGRIRYLAAVSHPEDASAMTAEEACHLLQVIRDSGEVDEIIVDLPATLEARVRGAWRVSDQIWRLEASDLSARSKTAFLSILYSEAKWVPVANRVLEETGNRGFAAQLPYIPEWKRAGNWDEILQHAIYREHVRELVRAQILAQDRGEAQHAG